MINFDGVILEKGMYERGNFTEVLEHIDSDEYYYGTALEDLDAFERQLKRFDIKVSGSNSDTVEKFFRTSDSAILFPEYVRRCVQIGIDENNIVADIVANTIDTSTTDYRSIYGQQKYMSASLSEQAISSSLCISTCDNLVPMHKHGKLLKTSYESLRFQKISTLTVLLKRIGSYIAKCQYYDAIKSLDSVGHFVLKSSDAIINDISMWLNAGDGYKLTTLLCSSIGFEILRKSSKELISFRDGGYYFGETKIIVSPVGPSHKIIGIDARYALELIRCGSVQLDYNRLIDKHFEDVEIYSNAGFSVVSPDAIVTVTTSVGLSCL